MTPEQILNRMVRQLEKSAGRKTSQLELSPDPADLVEEYFIDLWRPRLSGNAFLVWSYLCHRAEPESRIAGVAYRDLRAGTGIRGNRSLCQAIAELARFGYCIPAKTPTGPGLPRNYKIPEHIGSSRFPYPEAMRLCAEADRPRKRGKKAARVLREAAREMARQMQERNPDQALVQSGAELPRKPTKASLAALLNSPANSKPVSEGLPELPELDLKNLGNMDLDKEIERLEKEVEEIGKALGKEK